MNIYATSVALLWTTAMQLAPPASAAVRGSALTAMPRQDPEPGTAGVAAAQVRTQAGLRLGYQPYCKTGRASGLKAAAASMG